MSWWTRFTSLLRWIFATPPTCARSDCTRDNPCEDCAAFWSIK